MRYHVKYLKTFLMGDSCPENVHRMLVLEGRDSARRRGWRGEGSERVFSPYFGPGTALNSYPETINTILTRTQELSTIDFGAVGMEAQRS